MGFLAAGKTATFQLDTDTAQCAVMGQDTLLLDERSSALSEKVLCDPAEEHGRKVPLLTAGCRFKPLVSFQKPEPK